MTVDNQTKQTYIFNVDGDNVETNESSQAWLNTLLAQAEVRGRNEVFQAIQDGTLIMRRFMTKEQVKAEYEASLKERKEG